MNSKLNRGMYVYYAQCFKPPINTFNVIELKVNAVNDEKCYFSGCDTAGSKHTFLFDYDKIGKYVFFTREECLEKVKQEESKYIDED